MSLEKDLVPKYYKIKEYIKKKINDGDYVPHDKLMSESEIVKEFGVSRQPVIQAFKDLENEGLIYRVQGKGSFCAPVKNNMNKNIGVVLNGPDNYIAASVISGITNTLSTYNYNSNVINLSYSSADEEEVINEMVNNNVNGLIISPRYKYVSEGKRAKVFTDLYEKKVPFVLIDSGDIAGELPFVLPNDIYGGFIATQHLVELGHENILLFSPMKGQVSHNRYLGYVKALGASGIEVNEKYLITEFKEDNSSADIENIWGLEKNTELDKDFSKTQLTQTLYFKKIEELIMNNPEITAAFCFNDIYASILIESLHHLGIQVPNDFSVVGFDDSLLAVSRDIKLTTVAHPKYNYGKRAAEIIIDMIEAKKNRDYQELISVDLIVRDSTKKVKVKAIAK